MFRNQENATEVDNNQSARTTVFCRLFTVCITPRLPSTSQTSDDPYTLERAEVDLSKDRVDYADICLKVVEVTESFGKFVKLLIFICSLINVISGNE